jgi:hypothetical protein
MPDKTAADKTATDKPFDIIKPKFVPATSATSDFPVVEADEPKTEDATASDDDGELDEAETETEQRPEPAKTEAAPNQSEKPRRKSGVQKRIDELTKEREDWRRQAEAWKQQVDRVAPTTKPAEQKAEPPKEDARPRRQDFNDPDRYEEELVAWSGRNASKEAIRTKEQRDTERRQHEANMAVIQKWQDRLEKTKAKYADWDDVTMSDNVRVTEQMLVAMVNDDDGPEIAYWLGKNPQEAARIAALSPVAQYTAIGRIAELVTKAEPSKSGGSQLPKPIKPIGGRSAPSMKSPEMESMEEYAARRASERRGR